MLKPSRFASKKLPTNVYDINSINKFKLAERYLFSSTLFREEKFNFHIGIDLKQKSEILVATALVILKIIRQTNVPLINPIKAWKVFVHKSYGIKQRL